MCPTFRIVPCHRQYKQSAKGVACQIKALDFASARSLPTPTGLRVTARERDATNHMHGSTVAPTEPKSDILGIAIGKGFHHQPPKALAREIFFDGRRRRLEDKAK